MGQRARSLQFLFGNKGQLRGTGLKGSPLTPFHEGCECATLTGLRPLLPARKLLRRAAHAEYSPGHSAIRNVRRAKECPGSAYGNRKLSVIPMQSVEGRRASLARYCGLYPALFPRPRSLVFPSPQPVVHVCPVPRPNDQHRQRLCSPLRAMHCANRRRK